MLPDSKILIATSNIFAPTAPIGQLVGVWQTRHEQVGQQVGNLLANLFA